MRSTLISYCVHARTGHARVKWVVQRAPLWLECLLADVAMIPLDPARLPYISCCMTGLIPGPRRFSCSSGDSSAAAGFLPVWPRAPLRTLRVFGIASRGYEITPCSLPSLRTAAFPGRQNDKAYVAGCCSALLYLINRKRAAAFRLRGRTRRSGLGLVEEGSPVPYRAVPAMRCDASRPGA